MCLWGDGGKLSCLVGGLHILLCILFYPLQLGHTFVSCNNDAVLVLPESESLQYATNFSNLPDN